jgi:hypothetical protein
VAHQGEEFMPILPMAMLLAAWLIRRGLKKEADELGESENDDTHSSTVLPTPND